jgi:hypothetical protein
MGLLSSYVIKTLGPVFAAYDFASRVRAPIAVNASESLEGLGTFDFIVVVAYVLVTLGIVYRASRHQHDTDDYFLGNRRLPWMAVGLSIMATLLSSLTYLSVTGEVVKSGIAAFMTQVAIIPAAPLVLFLFIPFFMRLRFTSAYEYLEHRFDLRARLLGGGLFFLLRLLWVSMVMYSGSIALRPWAAGISMSRSPCWALPRRSTPTLAASKASSGPTCCSR